MTRTTRLAARALVTLGLVGALGCNTTPVVLANVPADDAGAHDNTLVRCVTLNDCSGGTYCQKDTCGAPAGTCALYPTDCDDHEAPECGCDGITYFNDCLRAAAGVAAGTTGSCSILTAVTCDLPGEDASTCPAGTSCARLTGFDTGPDCPHDIPGICWFLPPTCPASGIEGNLWDDCDPNGARCAGTCDAIRSGGVFRRADECPSSDGGVTHP